MTTPPIRNRYGDELTNFTDQLAYGVSQDPLTLEDVATTVRVLEDRLMPTALFEVHPRSLQWIRDHQVPYEDATHFVYGVPVRVEVDD